MTGFRGKMLLAGLLLLATSSSAQAWWGWGWRAWGYAPAYYGPVYYPVYPVCTTVISAAPIQKVAEAAKSNTSKEPPVMGDMMKKGPTVTETRSKSGGYAMNGNIGDRCKVGFWNLTGRDVTLKIDGRQQVLPKNRAVTLEMERTFVWQLDQGETVTERVPEEQAFHEVVLGQ